MAGRIAGNGGAAGTTGDGERRGGVLSAIGDFLGFDGEFGYDGVNGPTGGGRNLSLAGLGGAIGDFVGLDGQFGQQGMAGRTLSLSGLGNAIEGVGYQRPSIEAQTRPQSGAGSTRSDLDEIMRLTEEDLNRRSRAGMIDYLERLRRRERIELSPAEIGVVEADLDALLGTVGARRDLVLSTSAALAESRALTPDQRGLIADFEHDFQIRATAENLAAAGVNLDRVVTYFREDAVIERGNPRDYDPDRDGDYDTEAYRIVGDRGPSIYLTPIYYDASNRPLVLFHEGTHKILNTRDHAYSWETGAFGNAYTNLTPAQRWTNADTWALFAFGVRNR